MFSISMTHVSEQSDFTIVNHFKNNNNPIDIREFRDHINEIKVNENEKAI